MKTVKSGPSDESKKIVHTACKHDCILNAVKFAPDVLTIDKGFGVTGSLPFDVPAIPIVTHELNSHTVVVALGKYNNGIGVKQSATVLQNPLHNDALGL